MCGIIGAVSQRPVGEILLQGLRCMEYRGYDSAGLAIFDDETSRLNFLKSVGKVQKLADLFSQKPCIGKVGIAHTRWATHGKVTQDNAHPHHSHGSVAVAHNGIIENHEELRSWLQEKGYDFCSQTDTEVIAHLLHWELTQEPHFLKAVQNTVKKLKGAFALGIVCQEEPEHVIGVRYGSPLVVGLGEGENFIASDTLALLPVTRKFIALEEGDIVDIQSDKVLIVDRTGKTVERKTFLSQLTSEESSKKGFRHFMLKEIFEQPEAIMATLEGRLSGDHILIESFGVKAKEIFPQVKQVEIIACGTSYHAGLVAKYWLEDLANMPCRVEVASEFRYRKAPILPNTLFVTLSQSGETADTLAALRKAKTLPYLSSLAICNSPESSLVRESELVFLTRAGREIGVASTKAFTTQLLSLLLLTLILSPLSEQQKQQAVKLIQTLPNVMKQVLQLNDAINQLASTFIYKQHALFLGRGIYYPIALEGALKLKEISYLHAEAYPAGELKHGPLALVDKEMPVIAIAPTNALLEKLNSNLQEVRARDGQLIILTDQENQAASVKDQKILKMPKIEELIAPIVYTVPLQLLAYYVASARGTDVDQPRNLAKSVTVE